MMPLRVIVFITISSLPKYVDLPSVDGSVLNGASWKEDSLHGGNTQVEHDGRNTNRIGVDLMVEKMKLDWTLLLLNEATRNHTVDSVDMFLKNFFSEVRSDFYKEEVNTIKEGQRLSSMYANIIRDVQCKVVKEFSASPILVISSCPHGTNSTLRSKCESKGYEFVESYVIDVRYLPTQDERGIVYWNMYCAKCNGVHVTHTWGATLTCPTMPNLEIIGGGLNFIFEGQFVTSNVKCDRVLVPTRPKLVEHCLFNTSISPTNHRNRRDSDDFDLDFPIHFPESFSILMNFGFDGKDHVLFRSERESLRRPFLICKCHDDQIYDPINDICRKIICPAGAQLIHNNCVSSPGTNDATSKNVYQLTDINEPVLVVLNVNFSSEVFSMPAFDLFFSFEVSNMLNISNLRIQNLTSEVMNETLDRPILEIHKIGDASPPVALNVKMDSIPLNSTNHASIHNNTGHLPTPSHVSKPVNTNNALSNDTQFIRISFILLPAIENTIEKSIVAVLNEINSMVLRHDFVITLNNTKLNVLGGNKNQDITMDMWCGRGIKLIYGSQDFDVLRKYNPNSGFNETFIYVNKTKSLYPEGLFDLTFTMRANYGQNNTNFDSLVFVCALPRMTSKDCGRIIVSANEYTLLPNKSILLFNSLYNMNHFEYTKDGNDSVEICTPHYENNQTMLEEREVCNIDNAKFIMAGRFLTAILGSCSIIAMILVLITYSLLKELRNLPGVNMMNLTFALCLAEIIFMSGANTAIPWLCTGVGMSLHYLFLASFFWMNVMAYDVFRTFANTCILTRIRKKEKHLPYYALYAWGCPAVIVAVCAFVDFSGVFEGRGIGYGSESSNFETVNNINDNRSTVYSSASFMQFNNSIGDTRRHHHVTCWINEPVAALSAFGAPMATICIINAYFFIRTIICIRKTAKLVKLKTRRNSINREVGKYDVKLYMRMSTVMGFTWVFGLVTVFSKTLFSSSLNAALCTLMRVIELLYIIFNCSQGLFILFAFIFNKRVYNLYKHLFVRGWRRCRATSGVRQRHSSSSSSGSSRSSPGSMSTK